MIHIYVLRSLSSSAENLNGICFFLLFLIISRICLLSLSQRKCSRIVKLLFCLKNAFAGWPGLRLISKVNSYFFVFPSKTIFKSFQIMSEISVQKFIPHFYSKISETLLSTKLQKNHIIKGKDLHLLILNFFFFSKNGFLKITSIEILFSFIANKHCNGWISKNCSEQIYPAQKSQT